MRYGGQGVGGERDRRFCMFFPPDISPILLFVPPPPFISFSSTSKSANSNHFNTQDGSPVMSAFPLAITSQKQVSVFFYKEIY